MTIEISRDKHNFQMRLSMWCVRRKFCIAFGAGGGRCVAKRMATHVFVCCIDWFYMFDALDLVARRSAIGDRVRRWIDDAGSSTDA